MPDLITPIMSVVGYDAQIIQNVAQNADKVSKTTKTGSSNSSGTSTDNKQ